MPVIVEVDRASKAIFSTFTGELNENDFLSAMESMPTQPGFDPTFSHIIDLSKVTAVKVSTELMWNVARQPPVFSRAARQIIVAPQDHVFGLARMGQILREQQLPRIRVVRSLSQACEILGHPSASNTF